MTYETLTARLAVVRGARTDVHSHIAAFLRYGVESSRIIELGVRSGNSTVAFLVGLYGGGRLWSVDPDPVEPPIGDYDHWTFIQGDDLDPVVLAQLPRDVDVVFIDSSVGYDHKLAELVEYVPRVRPGGVVLLHDTNTVDGAPNLIRDALDAYCTSRGLTCTYSTDSHGLGTLHVPEGNP